mmetsp:Transcript_30564/g.87710  ORF Transcript_30564/g.87710 Transcript_30564/m.87710 type:complete len:230 (+) Transcript_30564:76-765(+)
MLASMPSNTTFSRSATLGASRAAGRISYATPSAGSGLMSAATQSAKRPAASGGGIGPRSSSTPCTWPSKRSKRLPSTRPRHSATSGGSRRASATSASVTTSSTSSTCPITRPSLPNALGPANFMCLKPRNAHSNSATLLPVATPELSVSCATTPQLKGRPKGEPPSTPTSPFSAANFCSLVSAELKRSRCPGNMASTVSSGIIVGGRFSASDGRLRSRPMASRSSSLGS